jgi:NADP-dependent 3-hydroxy acid dehydrogenase YdfG
MRRRRRSGPPVAKRSFSRPTRCPLRDVSDRDQVLRAVGETVQRLGRVDILVNNAGIHRGAPFDQETRSDWLSLFEVNVLGTVFPSQAVVPHMIEQGG